MGKGRRPLPKSVKQLRGNPGHRAVNESEPILGDGDPVCPEGLHADAKKEWYEILPILKRMKVVTAADSKALAGYCHAFHRWQQAERNIEELGIVLVECYIPKLSEGFADPRFIDPETSLPVIGKKYKKNPAVSISFEAMKTMKSYLIEFGLTPASRGKLHVEKEKEIDPMDQWIKDKAARNAAATQPN
jgi:P27 family predicted phage terminase small subunit